MKSRGNIDIPGIFHSYETGGLFNTCIDCDRNLLDGKVDYFIEKAIRAFPDYSATEVIFEYAICLDCANKMREKMSSESLQNIEDYISKEMNQMHRFEVMQSNHQNPEAWINECLITGKPKNHLKEYQLYAHCKGTSLQMSHMPYMISGAALDEISGLLSNKTLDELDNFMKDNLGPSPQLEEVLPTRKVILI